MGRDEQREHGGRHDRSAKAGAPLPAIVAALRRAGAARPCSRCAGFEMAIIGEASLPLAPIHDADAELGDRAGGLHHAAVIVVACRSCGLITQHLKAALGLP